MNFKDTYEETYAALSANMTRSGLTILGIVIGISSVIALVSIGEGATASIQSSIQAIGSNLLEITPGAAKTVGGFGVSSGRGSAQTLTVDDATAISSQVSNVAGVAEEISGRYQVTGNGTNTNTTVDGGLCKLCGDTQRPSLRRHIHYRRAELRALQGRRPRSYRSR